jgi:hypothetical protein
MMGRTPHRVARQVVALTLSAGIALAWVVAATPAQAAIASHDWEMNESSGGRMIDTGSTPTTGNWSNIQAGVSGYSGTAYSFNGTSSRVTVADASSLDPGSATFTATVHVNFTVVPTASSGGDYDLIRKGLSSTSGGYWKLEIYPASNGTQAVARCQMKGSSNATKITNAPYTLNDGAWHTISCTKTDTRVTLVVDGHSYSKSAQIGSISNSADLTLGAKRSGGDWYKGVMDAVTYVIG